MVEFYKMVTSSVIIYTGVFRLTYKRLRDLRNDHDKSQREVAEYLEMPQTTYSHYENGEANPPPRVLIKLAYLYGTSVDYLLGITDEVKPYKRK
jgi:transcriptional regulator with XRE-family HTH domain